VRGLGGDFVNFKGEESLKEIVELFEKLALRILDELLLKSV
jgi:hypothetical protein